MGSITLLLGKTRWRRRRAIPEEHLSGVDRYGRPTFLYLTDTQRKKEVVEREFLDHRRDRPTFAPKVRVLSELLEDLWRRHGDGRAPLTPRACALAAERLLAERAGAWPRLAAMGPGPAVADALARLTTDMAEARCDALDGFAHADEINAAVAALRDRLRSIPGRLPFPDAIEGLLARLTAPREALVEWLRSTHSVVLDDILQPSPLRREAIAALCRAWSEAGAHVVVAFESGRDLGGREAGAFFGYEDVDELAAPLKAFAATRAFRREMFDRFVAEGHGDIIVALRRGPVAVEPGSVPEQADDDDLSDHIYAGAPVVVADGDGARALLAGKVRLVECADPTVEVREVARQVKAAVLGGARPSDCVIAVGDLSVYGPALRDALRDHGVPHTITAGARLAASPVANVVRRVAGLALDGLPAEGLLALLATDLVRWPRYTPPGEAETRPLPMRRLLAWVRAAGVRDGAPATWRAPLEAWHRRGARLDHPDPERREAARRRHEQWLARLDAALAALEPFVAPLRALAEPATPRVWRDRLLSALDGLGLPDRVGRCAEAPEAAGENLRAWGAVLREIDDVTADLSAVHDGEWPAAELFAAADRALHEASFRPEPGGADVVQVIGVLDLRGLTPARVWLSGLVRGAFPRARGATFLAPRRALRGLEPRDELAEARYLLVSLLRNALGDRAIASCVFTWPATRDGQPVAPAPALADLLAVPVRTADGRVGPLRDHVVERVHGSGEVWSRGDALRAAAAAKAWAPLLAPADREQVAHQRAVADCRGADTFGAWDGHVPPPSLRRELRVTALETYLRCPARFWYTHVLGLAAPETWEPELTPDRRGDALHRILQRFYEDRGRRPLQGLPEADRAAARARLHVVAAAELDRIDAEGGVEGAYLDRERQRWLAGLVDDLPHGLLRQWFDHEADFPAALTPVMLEEAVGPLPCGPVALTGRADRVDRVDRAGSHAMLVTDYKTGHAPTAAAVRRGLALQPVAYAAAVAARHPEIPVAMAYCEVRRSEEVGRTAYSGDPAALAVLPTTGKPLVLDDAARGRLLDHAADGAERLLAGRYHTTLAEPEEVGCRVCDYRLICRHDAARAARVLAAGADALRPLPEEGA